jgi:hypothetical protein
MLSQQGSLPDCQFILDNRAPSGRAPLTTCSKEGQAAAAAKKRMVAKNDRSATTKKARAARSKEDWSFIWHKLMQ